MKSESLKTSIINQEICRICLEDNNELLDIFSASGFDSSPESLLNKFNIITISLEDPLKMICKSCIQILNHFEEFQSKAVSSQEIIQEILGQEVTDNAKIETVFVKHEECFEDNSDSQIILINDPENDEFNLMLVDQVEDDVLDQMDDEISDQIDDEVSNSSQKSEESKLECEFCLETYKTETNLINHIAKNHKDRKRTYAKKIQMFSCIYCGKRFMKKDLYENHIENTSCLTESSLKCRFCSKVFKNIEKLKNHLLEYHPDDRKHCCPVCFKSFPTASNKAAHMETHNPVNFISCDECGQVFKSILYLRKHQKSIHTKIDENCEICGKNFDSQQKLEYHLKSHESVKKYKCNFDGCDKSFMQHHHLENHKSTHTGIRRFLCFKCGKEFRQECNLKTHLQSHGYVKDSESQLKCSYDDCKKTFKTDSTRRSHIQTHKKSNSCSECGKKFSSKFLLQSHLQTHFQESRIECTEVGCNRIYRHEKSLKYHLAASHGIGELSKKFLDVEYPCEFCEKTFKNQKLLRTHMTCHLNEDKRRFDCERCEAKFVRLQHLRDHINNVHLKLKPFKCDLCDKSFGQKTVLKEHKFTHSTEKPFECYCGKAYAQMKRLQLHQKVHEERKF